jgi:hypothetical protein
MLPVNGDVTFWFCDSSHDTPLNLCRVLFDDQFPFRTLVILIVFLLSAMAQIIFTACCIACPSLISQYYLNPSERWLVYGDDTDWCRWSEDSSREKQKRQMRSDANFDFQLYSATNTVSDECTICLHRYCQDEEVVRSKHCRHAFHEDCLATWLCSRPSCPCCRVPLLKEKGP